jgi:hypothetical protein
MVQDYRKKVGMRTGGITLYNELKTSFIKQEILRRAVNKNSRLHTQAR